MQWFQRVSKWHRHFCLFPRQMVNGRWVWLESCWRRLRRNILGYGWFEYSDSIERPDE